MYRDLAVSKHLYGVTILLWEKYLCCDLYKRHTFRLFTILPIGIYRTDDYRTDDDLAIAAIEILRS